VLREQIAVLHRRLLTLVRDDEVCRRLIQNYRRCGSEAAARQSYPDFIEFAWLRF
jgi:hypothetical protein